MSNVEQLTPRNLSLKGGTGAIFVYLRLPYLAKYSIFIKGLYIIIDKAGSELQFGVLNSDDGLVLESPDRFF